MAEIISVKNVYYYYPSYDEEGNEPKERKYALSDVSLSVGEGEFVAVVGHNGSGKSTLAKHLNGLLQPDAGEVTVLGMKTTDRRSLFEIRKHTGMVFQNPDNQMVASIVEDDVAFGPENIGVPPKEIAARVAAALETVGMSRFRGRSAERLSGGQKQRIAIAGVLALEPKIIVFDESTAMLDPKGRREVLDVILRLKREQNITVVLITHFMDEAVMADRVVVMNGGKVFLEGAPAGVFGQTDKLREIGLDVPRAVRMAEKLREKGLPLPAGILTVGELGDALCRLL
jgi:energy-coupling factor transport system ATP-binding protein